MSRTLVVPLTDPWQDPERTAESALPLARALAESLRADVELLSVIEIPLGLSPLSGALGIAIDKGIAQWVRDSEDYLGRVARTFAHGRVESRVVCGEAAPEILALARWAPDPLIVMGSHGRGGTRRALLGSVAFHVVHEAPCPVIVVHAPFPGTPDAVAALPERILVPLDGTSRSEQVLETTLEIFDGSRVAIHLLRVVDPLAQLRVNVEDYLAAMRLQAGEYVAAVARRLQERGIEVTWDVRQGPIEEEILDVAAQQRVGMIAMATHGRAGLSRLMRGSVAERLTHEGHVPLLLVRPETQHGWES